PGGRVAGASMGAGWRLAAIRPAGDSGSLEAPAPAPRVGGGTETRQSPAPIPPPNQLPAHADLCLLPLPAAPRAVTAHLDLVWLRQSSIRSDDAAAWLLATHSHVLSEQDSM